MGSKRSRCGGKPASNRLRYGTAFLNLYTPSNVPVPEGLVGIICEPPPPEQFLCPHIPFQLSPAPLRTQIYTYYSDTLRGYKRTRFM
jgi:hypothetical protein